MQELSPQQSNEVCDRIKETKERYPHLGALSNHTTAITKELAELGSFDFNDDRWVLSDRAWEHWVFSGATEKYL